MFMQAWGNYGTAWPVVHQWLGVQPDLGRHEVAFVPEVPQGQTRVSGSAIRLGGGSAGVTATHSGNTYVTEIHMTDGVGADLVTLGHTLPAGTKRPTRVELDGHVVRKFHVTTTNRGVEVTVAVSPGHHTLVVTA
jgi:hypothetical protein